MTTMRAWLLDRPGSLDALRIGEVPIPEPGAGEVRVRLAAASLNPADWKLILRGWQGWRLPHIPGLDGAGVIDALGPGVTGFLTGDRVALHARLSRPGTFAGFVIADAVTLASVPRAVSLSDAAAVPCAGYTAWLALERLARPGGRILITAAGGGVGSFAVQLAKARGMHVTGTASVANHPTVHALGADVAIDYGAADLDERLRTASQGEGFDAILDLVGPESAGRLLPLLRYSGAIACVVGSPNAATHGAWPRGTSLHDIFLGGAYLSGDRRAVEVVGDTGRRLFQSIEAGDVQIPVARVLPFEGIRDGLVELSTGHARGKLVAQIRTDLCGD